MIRGLSLQFTRLEQECQFRAFGMSLICGVAVNKKGIYGEQNVIFLALQSYSYNSQHALDIQVLNVLIPTNSLVQQLDSCYFVALWMIYKRLIEICSL